MDKSKRLLVLMLPLLALGMLFNRAHRIMPSRKLKASATAHPPSTLSKKSYLSDKGKHSMALAPTIIASGAGASADNGTYTLAPGTDSNGFQYYKNAAGTRFLYFGASGDWYLSASLDDTNVTDVHYNSGSAQSAAFPLTGWVTNGFFGNSPAPTFSLPSTTSANFTLAFFSPSGGGPPNLTASWQQPAQGQPNSYNIYLGSAAGAETLALNVPGTALSHTFSAYGYGSVFGYVKAVYAGAEGGQSNEISVATPGAPQNLIVTVAYS